MFEKLQSLKEELATCSDFNILECFKSIDTHHTRFIDFYNLTKFLHKKGVKPTEEDIVAFVRRLDRDLDCRVSYVEFMEGIMPIEKKTKQKTQKKPHLYHSESKKSTPVRQSTAIPRTATKNLTSIGHSAKDSPLKSPFLSMPTSESKKAVRSSNKANLPPDVRVSSPSVSPFRLAKTEKPSPFSKSKENYDIVDLMNDQIKMENIIETIKQDLAIRKDVSLPLLYSMIDYSSKGSTNVTDLNEALQRLNVAAKIDEVYMLFNRFDRDIKGALNYDEVCDIFLPIQSEYASIFVSRKNCVEKNLSSETQVLVQRLLQAYIEVELEQRNCKRRLTDFHPRAAFKLCDIKNQGYFSKEDIEEFLAAREIHPSLIELNILMNKYDKNRDGKVTFSEFLRELQVTV